MDKIAKIEKQIEELALAVAKGFEEVHQKIDGLYSEMDRRFEEMNRRFEQIEYRLDVIDGRILGTTNRLDILEDKMRLVFNKIGLDGGSKRKLKNA